MTQQLRLRDVPSWHDVEKLWGYLEEQYKADKNSYNLRNLCLFGLLAFCGLRISEVLDLEKSNINFADEIIVIKQKKKKSEAVREVILADQLKPYLEEYVKNCNSKLFTISQRGARDFIYRLTKRVLGRRIRPHAFRHAFAIRLLDKTKNIEVVRRLLGHRYYSTVKIYLDFTVRDIKEEIKNAIKIT